jgi:hypothetical protein
LYLHRFLEAEAKQRQEEKAAAAATAMAGTNAAKSKAGSKGNVTLPPPAPEHFPSRGPTGEKEFMPIDEISQFLDKNSYYRQYSLRDIAAKKQRQLQIKMMINEGNAECFRAFAKSRLLLEHEHELLYYSLPFFNKLPTVSCIYSTLDHRRDLEELYAKTSRVSCFESFDCAMKALN